MSLAGMSLADAPRPPIINDLFDRDVSPNKRIVPGLEAHSAALGDQALREIAPNARQRRAICERLLGNSAEPSSEEILSLILCFAIKQDEARDLAKRLLSRFGGIGALLSAKVDHLLETCAGQHECTYLLKAVYLAMRRALREPFEEKLHIKNQLELQDYLQLTMKHEEVEVVRILFLNNRNRLLLDEEHARGTINRITVYPRNILQRVIEVNASAIVLVHNHPSGDPTPSNEDVAMTQTIGYLLHAMSVALHDHVIVGRHRCESMMSLGLIKGFCNA